MAKEAHQIIRSAGMWFTRDEWYDYLRRANADPSQRIVTTFGRYTFNDNDICITPDTHTIKVKDGMYAYGVTFSTAECGNGVWVYGLDMSYGTGGKSFGASWADGNETREWLKGYPSEQECKVAACKEAIGQLEKARAGVINEETGNNGTNLDRLKRMIQEYMKSLQRPKIVQLELF